MLDEYGEGLKRSNNAEKWNIKNDVWRAINLHKNKAEDIWILSGKIRRFWGWKFEEIDLKVYLKNPSLAQKDVPSNKWRKLYKLIIRSF